MTKMVCLPYRKIEPNQIVNGDEADLWFNADLVTHLGEWEGGEPVVINFIGGTEAYIYGYSKAQVAEVIDGPATTFGPTPTHAERPTLSKGPQ